ncbi:hypothetical protein, partial [Catenovulum sediminis]
MTCCLISCSWLRQCGNLDARYLPTTRKALFAAGSGRTSPMNLEYTYDDRKNIKTIEDHAFSGRN